MILHAQDLLHIVVGVRERRDPGSPEAFRKLIVHYLNEFETRCRLAGYAEALVQDARYAIVALIDESVMSADGPCRDAWLAQPLQLTLYGEVVAGEEFYRRLERLLAGVHVCRDAVEIYAACLALGFDGKFRMGGTGQREQITRNTSAALVGTALTGTKSTAVSGTLVAGGRRDTFLRQWRVALGAVALVVIVWTVCALSVKIESNAVIADLPALPKMSGGER